MPLVDSGPVRELLDQEIMLRCLAEAASTERAGDFASGHVGRQMLELRLRNTAVRRAAAAQCEDARAMRQARPSPLARRTEIQRRIALGQLLLDLRRGDLLAQRFTAAELRYDARALRAEAQQVRRRGRRF